MKLAHEMVGGHAKTGRHGRTPFELLAEAVQGVASAIERWWEWEQGSRGRRQLTWSGGERDLRRLAGVRAAHAWLGRRGLVGDVLRTGFRGA